MKKLLESKHFWRGVLATSVALIAVFISAMFNVESLADLFAKKGIEQVRGNSITGISVSIDGSTGSRVNDSKTYTINGSSLDSSAYYRFVLVVNGEAKPGWGDYNGSANVSHQVAYTFTENTKHNVVGVVQVCDANFNNCSEENGGGRSSVITVSTCVCEFYDGCGTNCNFSGFHSCMPEAIDNKIPMIQVCSPDGPVCENAYDWIHCCDGTLAPPGECKICSSCNNEECTPLIPSAQKPLTVTTRCIPGTGPDASKAGNVQISLVNLEPGSTSTPNSDPASSTENVSIVPPSEHYAVRARPEENQGRVFEAVGNSLGCSSSSGPSFEGCPWSLLPDTGGTFVFEIDCSDTPPPPPPPPPPVIEKPLTVVTQCIPGTGPDADLAGDVKVTLVNLHPDATTTPHADPARSIVNVSIDDQSGFYALRAMPTENRGRVFTPIQNSLGCSVDPTAPAFEWCPWPSLPQTGGTFVFEIDCSTPPPPPIIDPSIAIQKTLVTTRVIELGETATFRLSATNTGNTTLTTVPVRDEFETEYLDYATATMPPSRVDERGNSGLGVIEWTNILSTNEVLFPGQTKAWEVTFTATKSTDTAPDGDADNCMWILERTVRDDQNSYIPPEDLTSCDYVIIVGKILPTIPSVDIQKVLTTSGDVYIGDEVSFDIVITNTGTINLVEYDLIDRYDASYLRYLRAYGDKKESTGEWSLVSVPISFSSGGGYIVAENLHLLFGVLDPSDQIYVHIYFEGIRAGTTVDTARINAKGENGEWVYDEDSASVTILSVKPPKTGASEVIGLSVFALLGSGGAAKGIFALVSKRKVLSK